MMTKSEMEEFLKKDIEKQLEDFYSFSIDNKKDILKEFDLEDRKSFLNQMSLDELKKFIIEINFDKEYINLISSDRLKSIFGSFTMEEKANKFSFLKNVEHKDDLFAMLPLEEKREFLHSLSLEEVDQYFYYGSASLRNDMYQILGKDYFKKNVGEVSYRSARIVMGILEGEIYKKEADIRVLEGKIERLKQEKNSDSLVASSSLELDKMKSSLKVSQEVLEVSREKHKGNSDELNKAVSEFSKAVLQLRNKIPRDEEHHKRIRYLVSAEMDIVRHLSRNGSISEEYFNHVTMYLNDEEKAVFHDFMIKGNAIMSGKKEEIKAKPDEKKDDKVQEEKKDEEKKGTSFNDDIKKKAMEAYSSSGYTRNALGWYFNPNTDEYDEDYNPVMDPLFNPLAKEDIKKKAMEAYSNSGYTRNAFGWYFNPSTNEYEEGYDPSLDPLFNKGVQVVSQETKKESVKPEEKKIEGQSEEKGKSDTRVTVQRLVDYLNQSKEKFGVTFVSADDLKKSDDLKLEGKPIVVISERDKRVFLEFVGWKKTKKDNKKIEDMYSKIKTFIGKSEELGVSFENTTRYFSPESILKVKEEQGITSLTDEEKSQLKKSVIYQVDLEEQQKMSQGYTRVKKAPSGKVSYQVMIGIIVFVVLLIMLYFFIWQS